MCATDLCNLSFAVIPRESFNLRHCKASRPHARFKPPSSSPRSAISPWAYACQLQARHQLHYQLHHQLHHSLRHQLRHHLIQSCSFAKAKCYYAPTPCLPLRADYAFRGHCSPYFALCRAPFATAHTASSRAIATAGLVSATLPRTRRHQLQISNRDFCKHQHCCKQKSPLAHIQLFQRDICEYPFATTRMLSDKQCHWKKSSFRFISARLGQAFRVHM